MITAIVGHRGTGKTTFLERLMFYLGNDESIYFADLDTELEKKIGKSIHDLFRTHGEEYFRDLERQMFAEILQKPHERSFIVLGAGFDVSVIPDDVQVLWIRRDTDLEGRIFLDRPRLNQSTDPLTEYWERSQQRDLNFSLRADDVYTMPPGDFEQKHRAMAIEKQLLTNKISDMGGCLTVLPHHFRSEISWSNFKAKFADSGLDFFELRDDILTLEQIQQFLDEFQDQPVIFSLRKKIEDKNLWQSYSEFFAKSQYIDWAFEVGHFDVYSSLVSKEKRIGSLHRKEDFETWSSVGSEFSHLKLAPLIESFNELKRYSQWQQQDPSRRSFLPRSENGRWSWYRSSVKGKQLLNFIREGLGSGLDQPTLWQWFMESSGKRFAAVLGQPVHHSFTPLEHSDFFHKLGVSIYAIEISKDEFVPAMEFLEERGLSFAAVTSPLKESAALLCRSPLNAVNTLYRKEDHWIGTNTDDIGFLELIEGVGMLAPLQTEIVVWGGGGTLEMIRRGLPHARYHSSRTGELRDDLESIISSPKVLVWAAPRLKETLFPPVDWEPALVVDLNYKEDSMGKEYAQRKRTNYLSGLKMFLGQAREQRKFWKEQEGN